jgi:hypothetical protein
MQVISLENNSEQRNRIRCALDMAGEAYSLTEVGSLDEVRTLEGSDAFDLALIGDRDLDAILTALVFLRGRMPCAHLIACAEVPSYDSSTTRRLRDAGADLIFDSRSSPTLLARVINHFVRPRLAQDSDPGLMPSWVARRALLSLAPGAIGE